MQLEDISVQYPVEYSEIDGYHVTYAPGPRNWSAWSDDLPVHATGADRRDIERVMREAIAFHLECLAEDGDPIPAPGNGAYALADD
jgi:predicted RNase H-like HicB family nuclease